MKEEERVQKKYLIMYLSIVIDLHYKYFKNEEFDTFQQYFNSISTIKYSKKEKEKIFRKVDSMLEKRYGLFFAHYDWNKPIYLVDIANERKE